MSATKLASSFVSHTLKWSPVALLLQSAYTLILVILPFFVLRVYRLPLHSIGDSTSYQRTFGTPLMLVAALLVMARESAYAGFALWLLSIFAYYRSRRRWILMVCILAPLPVLYYWIGPYHMPMHAWIWGD